MIDPDVSVHLYWVQAACTTQSVDGENADSLFQPFRDRTVKLLEKRITKLVNHWLDGDEFLNSLSAFLGRYSIPADLASALVVTVGGDTVDSNFTLRFLHWRSSLPSSV